MDNLGTFRHRRSARSIPTGPGSRGGQSHTAEYWREYRARRKAEGQPIRNRPKRAHRDRSAEYAKRNAARAEARVEIPPLPQLYPELNHGTAIAFWEDELRMDLEQERILAELEGRDPMEAINAYRTRETNWRFMATAEIVDDIAA